MNIETQAYLKQIENWPKTGKHILANYDDETIIVYQAYRPSIGHFALKNGYFGGDFKYTRMSWIKPNFLWMMYRSGWGTKEGQEIILAIRLRREFFDELLSLAVPSKYSMNETQGAWKEKIKTSSVRLQWDPDHNPIGEKVERRAIQLGLRDNALESYGKKEAIEIINMSDFVAEQREYQKDLSFDKLHIPRERVYLPDNI
ncbi:hypothetical protein PN36_24805 [Candidatus Thiomargarita nelsonii]|uniref:DUF4291 domain-containing protein n=1 Tax=Candidatus Thiomargarita nelsonii TaxID=1003181 RepID=A0A0A6RPA1_9GAMM|nr:hypothetical protein PN36_24805 [Candidatus Thiomargarita nelsonii]